MTSRRVVVTGIGLITSLGLNAKDSWSNLIKGESGIKEISLFDISKYPCKIASEISNFNSDDFIEAREARKMDRFIHLGIAAAMEAVNDSGWLPDNQEDKDRTGVMFGSGIGGLRSIEDGSVILDHDKSEQINYISPYFIPSCLINLLSGHISIKYGFSGPNSAVCTACSTGAHAIGDAARMIKYGDADVMIAGSSEAPITPVGIIGFASARALAVDFNDRPKEASRPWDEDRAGFVMGEGAGSVVLEEYEHAVKRGAKIYGELVGYGLTGDAYHITAPNGIGAYRAMENALKDAKVSPEVVDYINAHGTSTKVGDAMELEMVQKLFQNSKKLSMSSTKSAIGHLLGGAGSVEAIFSILAMRDQIAPPTLNLHKPLPEAVIDLVPLKAKERKIDYALSNSFGFGGTNASLLFKKV